MQVLARACLLPGFILVIVGSKYPLCEIDGMGEFGLETFSTWGERMIRYLAWAGLCACFLLPKGIVRVIAGGLIGGAVMLGITLGKDALDLANMDAEMASSMELIDVKSGGVVLCVGLTILLLAALITSIPLPRKKSPPANEPVET